MDNINVFVYCSGKSGSSTLHSTFINNGYKSIHIHGNLEYQLNPLNKNLVSKHKTIFDLILYNMKQDKTIYIIDSYRLPIERKISGYFESFYKGQSYNEVENALDKSLHLLEDYNSIDEILDYFNLPSFTSFDFNKKYNILNYKNIKFIKIRFCDIHNWDSILSEIFDKKITITNDNLSKNKSYYNTIELIKNEYKIPFYIIYIVKNDYEFKIYNSKDEQQKYLDKWVPRMKPVN